MMVQRRGPDGGGGGDLMIAVAVVLLVLLAALAWCGPAGAQVIPAVPDVQLPEVGETAALERGDRAPWAGMLVRDEDLFGLQSRTMQLELQLANARTMYEEALAGRVTLLEAAGRAADERVELHDTLWRDRARELGAALDASRAREGAEWYEHPALWFAIGALVAGALSVGVAVAIGGG